MSDTPQIVARKRVLLVENEPCILQMLAEAMLKSDWNVGTADDGLEGFLKFQEGGWDVVVTDNKMPRMDGEKMTAEIKAISPQTPIILMSGLTDDIRDPNVYFTVLQKPFGIGELLRAIEIGSALVPDRINGVHREDRQHVRP